MVFNNQIPQPNNRLSDSQGQLLSNNQALNTWSNVDHYQLIDGTANSGKHKVTHWPDQVTDPATAANEPAMYAKAVTSLDVLQFSRVGGSAVPSPVTYWQSPLAGITVGPNNTVAIMDMSSFTFAFGHVITGATTVNVTATPGLALSFDFMWIGATNTATFFNTGSGSNPSLTPVQTGNVIEIKNVNVQSLAGLRYTLILYRLT